MKTNPKKVSGYIFNGQFYEAQEDLINALMMERVLMWVQGKFPNISNFHQSNVAGRYC